jgi:hypothetical protein
MNSLIISTLVLTVGVVVGQLGETKKVSDHCMQIYRTDRMEVWKIKKGSQLCTIDRESWSGYQYGLKVKDEKLYVISKGLDSELANFYVSDKEYYTFSASIYRPGLTFAHFITIVPTADEKKLYRFEYVLDDSDINANFRSILYVGFKDITSEGQALLFVFQLVHCTIMGLVLFLMFCKDGLMLSFSPFMCITMVGVSFICGFKEWHEFSDFLTYYGVLCLIGIIVGWINSHYGNGIVCAISAIITTLYYFMGGSSQHRVGIIVSLIFYCAFAAIMGYLNTYGNAAEKLNFTMQFASFWVQQFQFWSYAFMIYPGELHMRVWHGPSDYMMGFTGTGFFLSWKIYLVLLSLFVFQGVTIYVKFGTEKINLQGSHQKSVI